MKSLLINNLICAAVFASLSAVRAGDVPAPASGPSVAPMVADEPSAISYDYIEAGYVHGWLDMPFDLFEDHDGYRIALSKSLNQSVYLFAGFDQVFSDDTGSVHTDLGRIKLDGDLDSLGAQAGVGFHLPVTNRIDWVIEAGGTYGRTELDLTARLHSHNYHSDEAVKVDGFGVTGLTGFRLSLTSWLELDVFYKYVWSDLDADIVDVNVDHIGGQDGHMGMAKLIFRDIASSNFDFVLGGTAAQDAQSVSASVRYNF